MTDLQRLIEKYGNEITELEAQIVEVKHKHDILVEASRLLEQASRLLEQASRLLEQASRWLEEEALTELYTNRSQAGVRRKNKI
jgi:chromatin segregation and condensation protein Rec8/ScpA/Scc1 (kleisin family)